MVQVVDLHVPLAVPKLEIGRTLAAVLHIPRYVVFGSADTARKVVVLALVALTGALQFLEQPLTSTLPYHLVPKAPATFAPPVLVSAASASWSRPMEL